jgi:hypothetical protein
LTPFASVNINLFYRDGGEGDPGVYARVNG